jgi:glycerophosphoryl diester phosphodiesterase
MKSFKKYVLSHNLLLAAHRGASGNAPENTLSAYRKAVELEIPAIEIDVHLTKDGYVVAFHDDDLSRTANSKGQITDINYSELNNLEVGSWFSGEFKNEKIPTLTESLEIINNKSYLLLELKPFSKDPELFVRKVLDDLEKYDYLNKTLFVSFDYHIIQVMKKTEPRSLTAGIINPFKFVLPSKIVTLTNCDAVICSINELDDTIVNDANLHQIPIGCYDVDNIELLNKSIEYQIRGIGTNFPELIMNELIKRGIYGKSNSNKNK